MENVNIAEIITLEKQYEIQSPDGLSIIILITSQNWLNTLKEILIMYLCPAPSQKHLRKNLEAIFIALYKLSLNDQKSFDRLILFDNLIVPMDRYCKI